ncbi:MAG: hypothetical protein R3D44_18725, partial [Hyphomicrobiaceae bacterium]
MAGSQRFTIGWIDPHSMVISTRSDLMTPPALHLAQRARDAMAMGGPRLLMLSIALYEEAVRLAPRDPDLRRELAWAYHKNAMYGQARDAIGAAVALAPDLYRSQLHACVMNLQAVYESQTSLETAADRYASDLDALLHATRRASQEELTACAKGYGVPLPFQLPYLGFDIRPQQELFGEIIGRISAAYFARPYPARLARDRAARRRRIRIGFAFALFYSHSSWHVALKGWLKALDPETFELIGYNLSSRCDGETEVARGLLAKMVDGPRTLRSWVELIEADELDVLIYPELGMWWHVMLLASLRLAPVQCTGWGHFVTSGLPTIDYFLTGDLAEPVNAARHYTETLVRLPNLSVTYEPQT